MTSPEGSSSHSVQGIVLMVLTMLSIPIVDGIAKYLTAEHSPLFLGWARFAISCLVVLPIAAARYGRTMFPAEQRVSHLLRTVFLVIAMTFYFLAIARIPLATAVSTYFVGPIIAAVLAVLVLKERMTMRKGTSLVLGFAGSLVILRPGTDAVEPGILFALASGVFFAFYMIATRQASKSSDPIKTLFFQSAVGAVLLTPQAIATWSTPSADELVFFAAMGAISAFGHLLSIAAFRLSDASTLAPLVYVELIGAALIGYFAFNEVPGMATMIGAAMIVAAGLVLLQRQQIAAKA